MMKTHAESRDSLQRRGTEPLVRSWITPLLVGAFVAVMMLIVSVVAAQGQEARIRDLTVSAGDIPAQLTGYGIVIGLDGTGDRVIGGFSSGHTVRSIANTLRRFGIEVPENMLRTRNVAAVMVTAEASPYLRPGGRFDVHVSSVGDAVSLRGGVLFQTLLQTGPLDDPVALAQGPLLVAESTNSRAGSAVETTAALPEGGLLREALPLPDFQTSSLLYLKHPDLATAARIAEAIDASMGQGSATVQDPGAVAIAVTDSATSLAAQMAAVGALLVTPERSARVIIDGRAGTVIAGGDISIGEAVVSHGAMTLSIGGAAADSLQAPGDLRMAPGASVQDVAAALHGVAAPPQAIAAVFESLRQVGALTAQVSVR